MCIRAQRISVLLLLLGAGTRTRGQMCAEGLAYRQAAGWELGNGFIHVGMKAAMGGRMAQSRTP